MTRAAIAAAALAQPLEQAALHGALERRTRLQTALVTLCRTMSSATDFRKALREVHEVVGRFVDSPVFLIAVKDDADQWWMLMESDTVDGDRVERVEPRPIRIGRHEALQAIRTHSYWISHRTPEEIRVLEAEKPGENPGGTGMIGHITQRSRSILYASLRQDGEMVGYMSSQSYAYNAYTMQDAEDLILVGEYIGLAARNALREHQRRARRPVEQKLLDWTARFAEEWPRLRRAKGNAEWKRIEALGEELRVLRQGAAEGPVAPEWW